MRGWGWLGLTALLLAPGGARADAFDDYLNPILAKAPKAEGVEAVKQLTAEQMVQHGQVLPGVTGTFVVVRTNDGRLARVLVQPARHKVSGTQSVPIALIERFTTFREGEERAVHAAGQNVRLFDDFRFSLDAGAVVPAALGGDLRFVARDDGFHLEPVGKAELYLVTKPLPEAAPKKAGKLVVGPKFEPRYFNGAYKLHDDGRRSGTLQLKVEDNGDVLGHYYSDKDGQKYEVDGKVSHPLHRIEFKITLPRTIQFYQGYLFTGNGAAIAGTSRLQDRETGFYATRIED